MLRIVLIGCLLTLLALNPCFAKPAATDTASDLALMPYPQQLQLLAEPAVAITDSIAIWLPEQNEILTKAYERFLQRLYLQTGHKLTIDDSATVVFAIKLIEPGPAEVPQLDQDESYQLLIKNNSITLTAANYLGMLHGIETLLQLATTQSGQVIIPAATITDFPRFAWRGLLLDSARHFLPVDTIKRQIDGMAAMKLNVLHWHLTDDQGWRLESKRYPRLHQIGGKDGYYSQQDVRDVVQYAMERGIRVVPEIDLPGHTTALGAAYPELMAMPGPAEPEIHWGVHPAVLDPTKNSVYDFLTQLLDEVTGLFPDHYIHIGGDEVLADHWNENESIQLFMQQNKLNDHLALQAYFNQKLLTIVTELDRSMIGWDEVLTPNLDKSVLVQSWRGMDSMAQAAQQGHGAILSTGFYLDQPQTAAYHYRVDPQPRPTPAIADNYLAWSGWSLEAVRKRGSPIKAHLYLLYLPDHTIEGYIDFAGRSRQRLEELELEANLLRFQLDTWMGPVTAQLTLDNELSGQLIVGNAPYPVTGQQQADYEKDTPLPVGIHRQALSTSEQQHILGGEIALWGELVTKDVIDRRLWPQAAVVAERLWSAESLTDETSLYHRLELINDWLELSVGTQQQAQQLQGLSSIVDHQGLADLQQFIIALEPAYYYHRLHEKSVRNEYHNQSPLNRMVDYLPAESYEFRRLHQLTLDWLDAPQQVDIQTLQKQLLNWVAAPEQLQPWLKDTDAAQELKPIINKVSELASIALRLLDSNQPLTLNERLQLQAKVAATQGIHSEMVIALERLVSALLSNLPVSTIWLEGGFTSGIEGPAFGPDGYLYAVNFQQEGTIGRISPDGAAEWFLSLPAGHTGNGIQFDTAGNMLIADYTGHSILRYDPATTKLTIHTQNSAMNQPNDLTIAESGVIYASDPNWAKQNGQLWRIDTDGTSHLIANNIGTSNGIEIMPDQQQLWLNESVQRRIWRYQLKPDKTLGKRQLLAAFSDAGLDGMRSNNRGITAVTRYGKGTVILLDKQGRLLHELPLHHSAPTNVAFDQSGHLFVTLQDCGCIERITLPASSDEDRPQ